MTYIKAVDYIHSFTRFGSQLGLERMNAMLEMMGNPHKDLKFIHIAGTNGKGSTASMCTSIFKAAGYKVGTYISPFVVDFRERFQVDGAMIDRADFVTLVKYVSKFVDKMKLKNMQVTEFEVITAIAFEHFKRSHCEIVCLEVGLGGKYDATNVIDTPLAAVITSISYDHIAILGDTIEKIAGEKAGIIKNDTDVVTYPLQNEDAIAVLMARCAETNSTLTIPNAASVKITKSDVEGSNFIYNEEFYTIKFVGTHQVYNAVAVIEVIMIAIEKGFNINLVDIKIGLAKASFAARFEILRKHPYVILDGAHNKEAVDSLAISMDKLEAKSKIVIIGMMADKDYESAVEAIGIRCKAMITIPVDNPRAIDKDELATEAKKYCKEVYAIEDYEEAFTKAISLADKDDAIIVCGSFYMASDMRKIIKNRNNNIK